MTDFLLELRSEEIPARMQAKARDDLARLFAAELGAAGLQATGAVTYATPRRLTLILRGLPDATAAVTEEVKGPRTSAPPQALDGFLRKTGLTREALTERDGVYFAVTEKPGRATAEVLAQAIPAVIRAFPWPKSMRWGEASLSPDALRWVRPLHGIVALFGEELVPVDVAGVRSGYATLGHRFHHPGPITVGSAHDYLEKLRACHVIVDQAEREALIRTRANALAAEAGLELIADEGLVAENAGLTEWPVPLLGRFDEAFLDVPPEVIQLTARVNQKYFVCRTPLPLAGGAGGGRPASDVAPPAEAGAHPPVPSRRREGEQLANAFICTANIDAGDGGAKIVEGNRKVLAARLADARFFYEQDLKVPLEAQAKKLDRIVFHEKLGTVADKVDRVAKLARWLVEEGVVGSSAPAKAGAQSDAEAGLLPAQEHLATLAERAARLCKADLVTGMVGEFPELQGIMGGYYAQAQGEDPEVAAAIRDHYKPVGQGDDVPTAPVTVAVSLADKLDSLQSFFGADMPPTGSKDPFALRRAALAVIELVTINELRLPLLSALTRDEISEWLAGVSATVAQAGSRAFEVQHGASKLLAFFADRLKVQQREAGVRHDLIDAVFALGGEDDLVRLLARTHALQAFMATEDGANLLTGYRRAANILKKEGWDADGATRHPGLVPGSTDGPSAKVDREGQDAGSAWMPGQARHDENPHKPLSYTPDPAEEALIAALDSAAPCAAEAVAAERFEEAMAALASLRAPIDRFFDEVTVNDADPAKRTARLALLARMRDAVHAVADFAKIEG